MKLQLLLLGCLPLLLSVGCSYTTQSYRQLPAQNMVAVLDDRNLFAVHPDGDLLAYRNDGLDLLRLSDGYRQRLTYDSPDALLWSGGGSGLVAAYREAEKTRLVMFAGSDAERSQVFVDEQLTDLAWMSERRLLAIGQKIEEEANAVKMRVVLLIWDGSYDVERIPLYQRTFPVPQSSRLIDQYVLRHSLNLSPLKDELVYGRYIDPPEIGGRGELVLYNLLTRREMVLAETDYRHFEAVFAADGERLLRPAKNGQVILANPWTGTVTQSWPGVGRNIASAQNRDLYLIDGGLFSKNRQLLALPEETKGQFSADGTRLFALWRNRLYLVDGYPVPEEFRFSGLEKVNLQRIRQQRSRGEISIREYYKARNNILNP